MLKLWYIGKINSGQIWSAEMVPKRYCRTSLSLAKSGIAGNSKNRRGNADGSERFLLCLLFFIKLNKTAALWGNGQKMPQICGDTVAIGWGASCFLLAGDLVRNVPIGSSLLFGHFPKSIHYSVSVAEKVSKLIKRFPKKSPIQFLLLVGTAQRVLRAFRRISRHRFGFFHYILLEAACFLEIKKLVTQQKNLKNHQRFFSKLWFFQPYFL